MNHQLRSLQVELAKAKAEAAYLRKQLKVTNRHAKRIDKAYEDALLLAGWRAAGITPSRAYAKRYKMSQNRWQNAVTLLRLARVIVRHHHWATEDMAIIESRLNNARKSAIEYPDSFFFRHPRHHT